MRHELNARAADILCIGSADLERILGAKVVLGAVVKVRDVDRCRHEGQREAHPFQALRRSMGVQVVHPSLAHLHLIHDDLQAGLVGDHAVKTLPGKLELDSGEEMLECGTEACRERLLIAARLDLLRSVAVVVVGRGNHTRLTKGGEQLGAEEAEQVVADRVPEKCFERAIAVTLEQVLGQSCGGQLLTGVTRRSVHQVARLCERTVTQGVCNIAPKLCKTASPAAFQQGEELDRTDSA
mmetsp:Transcript_14425/g.43354  ORF Transcript_14425/g.43354 Transcript_14425/m.43354 type:complete len:239 (+) Transcript_14425:933-1649(+)